MLNLIGRRIVSYRLSDVRADTDEGQNHAAIGTSLELGLDDGTTLIIGPIFDHFVAVVACEKEEVESDR